MGWDSRKPHPVLEAGLHEAPPAVRGRAPGSPSPGTGAGLQEATPLARGGTPGSHSPGEGAGLQEAPPPVRGAGTAAALGRPGPFPPGPGPPGAWASPATCHSGEPPLRCLKSPAGRGMAGLWAGRVSVCGAEAAPLSVFRSGLQAAGRRAGPAGLPLGTPASIWAGRGGLSAVAVARGCPGHPCALALWHVPNFPSSSWP